MESKGIGYIETRWYWLFDSNFWSLEPGEWAIWSLDGTVSAAPVVGVESSRINCIETRWCWLQFSVFKAERMDYLETRWYCFGGPSCRYVYSRRIGCIETRWSRLQFSVFGAGRMDYLET